MAKLIAFILILILLDHFCTFKSTTGSPVPKKFNNHPLIIAKRTTDDEVLGQVYLYAKSNPEAQDNLVTELQLLQEGLDVIDVDSLDSPPLQPLVQVFPGVWAELDPAWELVEPLDHQQLVLVVDYRPLVYQYRQPI